MTSPPPWNGAEVLLDFVGRAGMMLPIGARTQPAARPLRSRVARGGTSLSAAIHGIASGKKKARRGVSLHSLVTRRLSRERSRRLWGDRPRRPGPWRDDFPHASPP